MSDLISASQADLIKRLNTVSVLSGKVVGIFGSEFISSISDQMAVPAAGVAYAGAEGGDSRQGQGMVGTAEFLVILIGYSLNLGLASLSSPTPTLEVLNDMRNAVKLTDSPSCHDWVWNYEKPLVMDAAQCQVVYVQSWTTKVPML